MKKFLISLLLTFSLFSVFSSPASAAWRNYSRSLNGYSLVGLHVLNVTFHASGESTSSSGRVSNMYFTDWAWFPNTISNRTTWKSHIPRGQRANGSVRIGTGINSPWGAVNLWGGQHYLSINF